MGTRSTFRVLETGKEDGKDWKATIMLMYMQYDGYPEGRPMEVAEFLNRGKLVNGIGVDRNEVIFNGAGCLAAQLVSKFKDGAGGVYLYAPSNRGKSWEDYLYDIIIHEGKSIKMIAYDNNTECGPNAYVKVKKFFEGTPEEFIKKFKGERVQNG